MKAAFTTALLLIILLDINIADARKRKKRTDLELNSDADVLEYLERQEQDMLIFKCKRLVMVKWLHSVLPYIDLQCQVMGDVIEVQWFYNDTLLDTGNMAGRHMSLSQPHYRKGTFYDKWFDYKLRLLQVTEKDNGWYTIKAKSPQGLVEQGIVLLEVKTNYSDDKWIEWMEKVYKDSSDIKKRKPKSEKKDAARLTKKREKDLMKMIKKRAQEMKKSTGDGPLIFVGN